MDTKITKDKVTPEEQSIWESLFQPLVSDKKGINKTKLIKLLYRHYKATEEVIRVYHHVTDGSVTNIMTPASDVIDLITQLDNKNLEGILADERKKWTEENLRDSVVEVNDTCLVRRIAQLNQFHTTFEVTLPPCNKINIVFDSRDRSIMSRPNKSLPPEWNLVVAGACLQLHSNLDRNELMVTK